MVREFRKGLEEVGPGCWAWIQPDGTWGFSNSGLVADQGESLLVDTLYDLPKTREMLEGYRKATPAAKNIGALVNTHGNGDHYFGNQAVDTPRIIATKACAEEMKLKPPAGRAEQLRNWRQLGDAGRFFHENLGDKFNFDDTELVLPTETFEGTLKLKVGAKSVELHNVGPAHTSGDALVWVPEDRIVYTGDIIFAESHPIVWDGPVKNWIKACELMIKWNPAVVVAGHGPVTDLTAVRETKHYFEVLTNAARKRFDAGMPVDQAIRDVSLDEFKGWKEGERIVVNMNALYNEFKGLSKAPDFMEMSAKMLHYRNEQKAKGTYVE